MNQVSIPSTRRYRLTFLACITMLFLLFSGPLPAQESSSNPKKTATTQQTTTTDQTSQPAATTQQANTLWDSLERGGPIMIPIMLLAFLSLTLIIERLIYFSRTKAWLKSRLFETLAQFKKQSDARYREEMEDDLSQKIHAYIQRMERGVPLINGIGNIAPILGFFGTVVGMIRAFAAIAAATTVNAKVVAVGIQIALVTTAGGLAVAVPSLFFYHFFMHIIHKSYAQADVWIQEEIRELPRLSSEAE